MSEFELPKKKHTAADVLTEEWEINLKINHYLWKKLSFTEQQEIKRSFDAAQNFLHEKITELHDSLRLQYEAIPELETETKPETETETGSGTAGGNPTDRSRYKTRN